MKTTQTLYKESLALLKECWGRLVVLFAALGVISLVFGDGLNYLVVHMAEGLPSKSGGAFIAMVSVVVLLAIVQIALSWATSLVASIAPIHAVSLYEEGKKPSLGEVLMASLRKLLPYFWVSVLLVLVVVPGLVLFVIPGLYLSVILSFAMYANILEGKKGLQALAYSFKLYEGRFWVILGKQLMALLYAFPALLAVMAAVLLGVLAYTELGLLWAVVVGVVLGIPALFYAVRVSLILFIYPYKLYRDAIATCPNVDAPVIIPKWLKVAPWVGLGVLVITFVVAMAFGFLDAMQDAREKSIGSAPSSVVANDDGSGKFSDGDLSFTYSSDIAFMNGDLAGDGSIAIFVDAAALESEDSEAPYISIGKFPSEGRVGAEEVMSAVKEYYETSEDAQGFDFTINTRSVNGIETVEVDYSDASDELIGKSLYVETDSALYVFAGAALAQDKVRLEEMFSSLAEDLSVKASVE